MKINSVRLENIGGFRTTEIELRENCLLVGENNSGKTSILRILDWVLNVADADLLHGRRPLSETEVKLLIPARATRNKARRIILNIAIPDGRVSRKYNAVAKIAELRIQFRSNGTYAMLGAPVRGEAPVSESRAVELLSQIQKSYCALYVAAARDPQSQIFQESLRKVILNQFKSEFLPQGRGLTSKARKMRNNTKGVCDAGKVEAAEVWSRTQEYLSGVFSPNASFDLDISVEALLEFLVDRISPMFSFGEHDIDKVPVDQLGAGTQSVLAMALTQLSMVEAQNKLLLLEEPEAFLHPSAQRMLAWQIFGSSEAKVLATTHSSYVLAEADPAEVVVMRDHVVHTARRVEDDQNAKDRYLLSTWVAGSMFDRSLLLVEGPGDLAFFESLRRRLEGVVSVSVLSRIRVAAVGGKASFGPWLRLLRRYRDPNSGNFAFNVLMCADSADAGPDVLRALQESKISLPAEVRDSIRSILDNVNPKNISQTDADAIASKTADINRLAESSAIPLHLMPVDLEYSITAGLSDERAAEFSSIYGWANVSTGGKLAARLGSKGGDGSPSSSPGSKAPHVRSEIASFMEWGELSPSLKDLVWRWLLPAFDEQTPSRPKELDYQ
ncbi:ATP-dependent nuclease [Kocuria rhizophila]|uniref:ATP-dependent nuclease n=1 Tax=Kocuria rhizophila TaxID=72000 RepID=UPI003D32EB32